MQGFLNPPVFSKRKDFSIRLLFQQKQGFLNPPDFFWLQVFVHISVFYFSAFFIKYAPHLIGAIISGL
jgi:hypothetical protein